MAAEERLPGYKLVFDPDGEDIINLFRYCPSPRVIRGVDVGKYHPYDSFAFFHQANDVRMIHLAWSPLLSDQPILVKDKTFFWSPLRRITHILSKSTKLPIGTRQRYVLKLCEGKSSKETTPWMASEYKSLEFEESEYALYEVCHESTSYKRAISLMKTARTILDNESAVIDISEVVPEDEPLFLSDQDTESEGQFETESESDSEPESGSSNHSPSLDEPIIRLKKVQPQDDDVVPRSFAIRDSPPQTLELNTPNTSVTSLSPLPSPVSNDKRMAEQMEALGFTLENLDKSKDTTGNINSSDVTDSDQNHDAISVTADTMDKAASGNINSSDATDSEGQNHDEISVTADTMDKTASISLVSGIREGDETSTIDKKSLTGQKTVERKTRRGRVYGQF